MPNKLTIAYIIVIISVLIAIVIVVAPMFKTPEQTIEQVATTTSTMSTVPSPLTFASLQALPDWNPTMEVKGMKRVEDNNPELEVKNLPIHTEEIKSNNSSSTFVVKYLEPEVSNEACEKYGLVGKPSEYMSGGHNCLITQPSLFNEIIIISKETGEVLHKYRLEEGYSLIGGLNVNPFEIININRFYDVKYLNIFIYEWDHSGTVYKKIGKNHSHKLNMLTGELISVGE